jgi:hypothetical protein
MEKDTDTDMETEMYTDTDMEMNIIRNTRSSIQSVRYRNEKKTTMLGVFRYRTKGDVAQHFLVQHLTKTVDEDVSVLDADALLCKCLRLQPRKGRKHRAHHTPMTYPFSFHNK